MAIALGVFVLVALLLLVPYWAFVVRPEDQSGRTLRKRLTGDIARRRFRALVKTSPRTAGPGDGRSGGTRWLQQRLDQAGVPYTVQAFLVGTAFAGFSAAAVTFALIPYPLVAIALGCAAATVPFLLLRRKAAKRLELFEQQFPEAIDLMARAMRAGHTLPSALQTVGEEIPRPVGEEFRVLFDQQNYGMSLSDALKAFAARMPLLDARFFVTAVLTQREVGGNLSEVLDNLANVIRERFKVKRQVRVVSAHGRITGWVLGFLPPAVAVILFVISPTHMRVLIDDPMGVFARGPAAAGAATSWWLSATAPEQRRLRSMAVSSAGLADSGVLLQKDLAGLSAMSRWVKKSPKEMSRLQLMLTRAGYPDFRAAVYFSIAEVAVPLVLAGTALIVLGIGDGLLPALVGAALGYAAPGLYLGRQITRRQKAIRNGLPDALDLLTVCVEAGCGLDQAVSKASEELAITHPALAGELRLITVEIRAGKARLEAFKNFAHRTGVEDVRSLVSMLTQTDRFGTSIGQALRVQSDTSRTKRRQAAEERAAKVGVKLVFPLVLCLFPALYVVCFGPVVVRIYRAFFVGL